MRLKESKKILEYDKTKKPIQQKPRINKKRQTVKNDWSLERVEKKSNYPWYLLAVSVLFLIVSFAVAFYVKYIGSDNTISTNKVLVEGRGVKIVNSGDTASIDLLILNKNPVDIQNILVTAVYPDGVAKRGGSKLKKELRSKDEIAVDELVKFSFSPILYGIKDEEKEINFIVEYTTNESNAVFEIKTSYSVLIREHPILIKDIEFTNPTAGKPISFTINFEKNTKKDVKDVFVEVEYPFNFLPKSSSVKNYKNTNNIWYFDKLQTDKEQSIVINGILTGKYGVEEVLKVKIYVSPYKDDEERILVADKNSVFSVEKSFIETKITSSQNKDVFSAGDFTNINIEVKNIDDDKLEDLSVVAILDGNAIDLSSISVLEGGYYDYINNRIVWDKSLNKSLTLVPINGVFNFSFSFGILKSQVEFGSGSKSGIISVDAKAKRVKTGIIEEVNNIDDFDFKVRSDFQVVGYSLYSTSKIKNGGPLPPKIGNRTEYVLQYIYKNAGNDIKDFQLEIPLTKDVKLTGNYENVLKKNLEYDEGNNVVKINIPKIEGRGASSSSAIEVQVYIEPKQNDLGNLINLSNRASYSFVDLFTNEKVNGSVRGLTTDLKTEPLSSEFNRVVE